MDSQSLANLLRQLDFSSVLPEPVLTQLAQRAELRQVAAGAILFREGETHDALYLIQTGHLALEMCLPARGCTRLLTLGPGDLVAWSALCGDGRMTTAAVATEPAELLVFSGRQLRLLCEADHDFGYALMLRIAQSLAKRLLATRLQLLDLFAADAPAGARL